MVEVSIRDWHSEVPAFTKVTQQHLGALQKSLQTLHSTQIYMDARPAQQIALGDA